MWNGIEIDSFYDANCSLQTSTYYVNSIVGTNELGFKGIGEADSWGVMIRNIRLQCMVYSNISTSTNATAPANTTNSTTSKSTTVPANQKNNTTTTDFSNSSSNSSSNSTFTNNSDSSSMNSTNDSNNSSSTVNSTSSSTHSNDFSSSIAYDNTTSTNFT